MPWSCGALRGARSVLESAADGVYAPRAVHLADLCGNGRLDLIVVNGNDRLLIFLGLGDGRFGPEVNGGQGLAVGNHPADVAVADLTGHGARDLAVVDTGSNDLRLLFGEGHGTDWPCGPFRSCIRERSRPQCW